MVIGGVDVFDFYGEGVGLIYFCWDEEGGWRGESYLVSFLYIPFGDGFSVLFEGDLGEWEGGIGVRGELYGEVLEGYVGIGVGEVEGYCVWLIFIIGWRVDSIPLEVNGVVWGIEILVDVEGLGEIVVFESGGDGSMWWDGMVGGEDDVVVAFIPKWDFCSCH